MTKSICPPCNLCLDPDCKDCNNEPCEIHHYLILEQDPMKLFRVSNCHDLSITYGIYKTEKQAMEMARSLYYLEALEYNRALFNQD